MDAEAQWLIDNRHTLTTPAQGAEWMRRLYLYREPVREPLEQTVVLQRIELDTYRERFGEI